jgi:hypothetical protein
MYPTHNIDQVHQLFNESKKKKVPYKKDENEYF